jgi:hypothetical protein
MPLQALQPGDLGPLLDNHLLEGGDLAKQQHHQFSQLGSRQAIKVFRRDHT